MMRDISLQNWKIMAEFNNAITAMVDQVDLTPPEVITVLEMILGRLNQLLEAKKAG